jgi:hypothetical protein
MIELAARMEPSIDLALAMYHARTADTAVSLLTDILWRVPLGVRIDQLGRALDDVGLTDAYPFAIPIARKVVEVRNLVAHSVAWTTDDGIVAAGHKRGRPIETLIDHDYALWLAREGLRCEVELDRIAARIGDWRVWASLHGFDDRTPVA